MVIFVGRAETVFKRVREKKRVMICPQGLDVVDIIGMLFRIGYSLEVGTVAYKVCLSLNLGI